MPPEPLKFLRHQMNVDDIDGARPSEKKHNFYATRNQMDISDIDGAKPKFGHEIKERSEGYGIPYNYNPMHYRDVTHNTFVSSRHIDPLMPTYVHRDGEDKLIEIGKVDGSKPNALPPARTNPENMIASLKTSDIHGCKADTAGLGSFHTRERRGWHPHKGT
jgi:hypothetical protein